MTNASLIERAGEITYERRRGQTTFGQVGSALLTPSGAVHVGVCVDMGSGMGFCAEHAAAASLVTRGETQIAKIVAVWKSPEGELHVLPPCGRCREFLYQLDSRNLDTEVVLGADKSVPLRALLPYAEQFSTEPQVARSTG